MSDVTSVKAAAANHDVLSLQAVAVLTHTVPAQHVGSNMEVQALYKKDTAELESPLQLC